PWPLLLQFEASLNDLQNTYKGYLIIYKIREPLLPDVPAQNRLASCVTPPLAKLNPTEKLD
ncbi:hypothetical protein NUV26_33520, partial [Burkholderia pseudomultivorans]|uniref:hypothetical protein n=1 Tax=Burkholderia pseudomultivorans TaxID=1207504 RepID=UPI002874573E